MFFEAICYTTIDNECLDQYTYEYRFAEKGMAPYSSTLAWRIP